MPRSFAASGFALLLMLPALSFADTSVGARAGTLGLGLEVSYAVSQRLALRVGADAASRNAVITQDEIQYDANAKLRSASLLADWFPFANNFRVSLGAIINGNKVTATGKPDSNGKFNLSGQTFDATEIGSLNGQIEFKKTAPYIGIGYGRPINKGFSFIADLGVAFQGSPKATLSATCTPTTQDCAGLQRSVAEEQDTLNNNIRQFKYYPVLSLGLAYTF